MQASDGGARRCRQAVLPGVAARSRTGAATAFARPRRVAAAAAIAVALAAAPAAGADSTLHEAERLIAARQSREAYALLLPLESQRAGDPRFDYLLALAALDAGQPERAVFALERVLAREPDNLQARAELARAYFLLGERASAQREFETVKTQPVPDEVRNAIDRYLSALAPEARGWRAYVEATAGYDSNINVATARSTIALPGAGGSIGVLAPSAVQQGSGFAGAAAGGSAVLPLSARWALVAGASAAGKWNFSGGEFDSVTLDGSVGARWRDGAHTLQAGWIGQSFRLDNQPYRNTSGVVTQWQWAVAAATEVSAFGQFVRLTYPAPGQEIRNADRAVGGLAIAHGFAGAREPTAFASLYAGSERTLDAAYAYLGYTPIGVRVGGQLHLGAQVLGFAGASYEHRRYDGEYPLFLATREDNQFDVRVGLTWRFARDWSLTPSVLYTRNDSNIDLFAYTRTLAGVTLRRDF